MKKRVLALLMATIMTLTCAGCGNTQTDTETPPADTAQSEASSDIQETPAEAPDETPEESSTGEQMSIEIAATAGGLQGFPIYIAQKNGWFEEENLNVNVTFYENGPVQVEAISTWDLATTGIGGILAGVIGYDAKIIASSNTDNGTQTIYVRPDSAIAAAGQGNNSLNEAIYGDADSWKGSKVLCSAGTVLQYMLIKVLDGFGLTIDDVEFVGMDTPTTNSAFLAGEGDVAVLTGVVSFDADKADYVLAANGATSDAGLDGVVIANQSSAETKHDEIVAFLKAYLKAVEWIDAHKEEEEVVNDLVAFYEESGKTTSAEAAKIILNSETYYSLEDNYDMLHNVKDGDTYVTIEQRIVDVLEFFISAGNYQEGDDERFVGHVDSSFVDEICGK